MDWGLITGLAAICGVIINFIRIGHWQGNIETRVATLEKHSDHHDVRLEEIADLIYKQNDLLHSLQKSQSLLWPEC